MLCTDIIQRHIKSAFNGAVAGDTIVELLHTLLNAERVFPLPQVSKIFCYFKAGSLGLSNDHGKCGTFANAIYLLIGKYPDKNILCKMHRPCRNRKRVHRYAELINIRACYFHNTQDKEKGYQVWAMSNGCQPIAHCS